MDRREQRFQKRTAVTKEQALNFLCATMRLSKIVKPINAVRGTATGSRSPAGPRRLRNSDAHKRIAVPKAFCVLQEHPRPSPKSGKVCRSDTRPGDVRERAVRVEGSDSGPVRKAPVSACKPLCAIFLRKPRVYAFACESERRAFVREVEKRDEKRFGTEL